MEVSLLQLGIEKRAKIKRIEGGFAFQQKIASLNIRIGKMVRKITAQPFWGPVVIEIDNTKITLGRGMAMKIFVEVEK